MGRPDLDGIWTVLSSTIPAQGVSIAPTSHRVAAGPVMAGVDSDGRRHLLVPLLPGEAVRTDTKGRGVQLGRISHGNDHYLTVVCLLPELHPVFTQFCRELADSVEDASSPARETADAFERWRTLFSEASTRGILGQEALIGLLGELDTLLELLRHGAPGDLEYWTGPLGAVHDFRSLTHAIETKSTLIREGRVVGIASVDQLQEPPGSELLLRHTRFERDPGGWDLATAVDQVVAQGGDRSALERRISELGVDTTDLSAYAGRKYRIVETRTYDVTGAAFPRLVRSSFAVGDVPAGTLRISYSIDLTNEPPAPLSPDTADAALGALAQEAADALDS